MKDDLKYVLVSSIADLDSQVISNIRSNVCEDYKVVYLRGKSSSTTEHFDNVCNLYNKVGVTSIEYCDLEQNNDSRVINLITNCDILHLGGGNTFEFANRINTGKYTSDLIKAINNTKLVVGESAGAIILTDDLEIANALGENNTSNEEMSLNLLDLSFLPHYNKIAIDMSNYQTSRKRVIYGVNDGGAILIDSNGSCSLFNVVLL